MNNLENIENEISDYLVEYFDTAKSLDMAQDIMDILKKKKVDSVEKYLITEYDDYYDTTEILKVVDEKELKNYLNEYGIEIYKIPLPSGDITKVKSFDERYRTNGMLDLPPDLMAQEIYVNTDKIQPVVFEALLKATEEKPKDKLVMVNELTLSIITKMVELDID